MLHEPGSYVGEVVKLMSKKKILVKVQPEGKYVVDFDDKLIKLEDIKPNLRVALRNDTYALHKVRATPPPLPRRIRRRIPAGMSARSFGRFGRFG